VRAILVAFAILAGLVVVGAGIGVWVWRRRSERPQGTRRASIHRPRGCAGPRSARYRKATGLRPNLYWSLGRGPHASVRLPGGFRIGHRL
jgi:hypothetical protein